MDLYRPETHVVAFGGIAEFVDISAHLRSFPSGQILLKTGTG